MPTSINVDKTNIMYKKIIDMASQDKAGLNIFNNALI